MQDMSMHGTLGSGSAARWLNPECLASLANLLPGKKGRESKPAKSHFVLINKEAGS